MLWLIAFLFAGMAVWMAAGWAFQAWRGNGGWTDVFWSCGMGGVGAAGALLPGAPSDRQVLVAVLVALWSARLGLHIARRVLTTPEDARYAQFRTDWAPHFQRGMFWFLQQQAAGGALLLISAVAAAHNPAPGLTLLDLLGGAILIVAILGEGLADSQLHAFARDPANRGKVCDIGLWSWSRHPNYFFEWLSWMAYPLIAVDLSGPYASAVAALIAPVAMFVILRFVTGVPPLEQHMLASRGEAFRAYQARVSIFFPLPPRSQLRERPAP